MNTLQKSLLSAATILCFSFYSYYLRAQDTQLALAVSTADASNIIQQTAADGSAPPPDLQAYADQIRADAKNTQPATPKPRIIRFDDDDEEEEDDEDGQRTVSVRQVSPQVQQQTVASVPTTQQQAVQSPAPIAARPAGQYKDGSYTGASVNVYYGYVQVQAIVRGGKIADVKFLQYPSDRTTSQSINSQAMPLLTQEAIQAQSANVNGVSGASATSQGFIESLTGALSQARV
ncbi:MAG: FMN-binding protein [Candidatus Paceibacterota bacterium]